MKRSLVCFSLAGSLFFLSGCSMEKVEAGHVGVIVHLLGGDKGVDNEVVGVGRYFLTWNQDLYIFPTFQQTHAWVADQSTEKSFVFQTIEGLTVSADVSISYTIDSAEIPVLFQKYRKGVKEITEVYIRNLIRDALVQVSSTKTVEFIYGEGKTQLLSEVNTLVSSKLKPIGISVDMLSFVGNLKLPDNVVASINAKIEATQLAQQRENELRQAKAEAEKRIAQAQGEAESLKALAQGEAEAARIKAFAQAEANERLAKSITPVLTEYLKVQTWNGELPKVTGSTVPMLSISSSK